MPQQPFEQHPAPHVQSSQQPPPPQQPVSQHPHAHSHAAQHESAFEHPAEPPNANEDIRIKAANMVRLLAQRAMNGQWMNNPWPPCLQHALRSRDPGTERHE